jgi:hypothetical protein
MPLAARASRTLSREALNMSMISAGRTVPDMGAIHAGPDA